MASLPPLAPGESLAAQGENYLYGNTVPQDCTLAKKVLLTAAQKKSVHAQTLLGAMYATGHCVDRDLPSSYRWFASALSLNPGNHRLQSDVEMVWRQMTPEEQKHAANKSPQQ